SFGSLFLAVVIGATGVAFADSADQQPAPSQLSAIAGSCKVAQQQIKRVELQDSITRTNRGHAYQGNMLQLMASFNSRAALNKRDVSKLAEITNTLQTKFSVFYDDFTKYDAKLVELVNLADCQKQPALFYAALTQARGMRQQLADDTKEMDQLIAEYFVQVGVIRTSLALPGASQ
ncbi:MAG: hypothetical protein ACMG55_06800, partial [Microcoleus sp.]